MHRCSVLPLCALSVAICALTSCRGSYDATFSVTSASSGAPIPGATIQLTYPQRRYFTPGNRTLVADENGQVTTRIRRWPFMVFEVDHAGYAPHRTGVYRRLDQWEARALPIVRGAEPGQAPSIEPVVFPSVDVDREGERVFDMPLAWDGRPTIRITLPEGYEGVLLLEKQEDEPELPDAPSLRLFDVDPGDRATAPIPSWSESDVPFVLYRFERAGQPLPPYPRTPGGDSARVIRDLNSALLVVVGPEQAHRAMRRLLWDEDVLEQRLVWDEEVSAQVLTMLKQADEPLTVEAIAHTLGEPYWANRPERSGSTRMVY